MPEILPFRGFYYNPGKIRLDEVLSPPYDVIPPERQGELYASHPRNAVRLELGKEQDRYTSAAKLWREWQMDGTVLQDIQPAIYLLCQTFKGKNNEEVRRIGFIALCRLEELGSGMILPHEKTFPKPKEDRLKLLTHTRAQFSPIFSIYADRSKSLGRVFEEVSKSSPLLSGDFEGTRIHVWGVTDVTMVKELQGTLRTTQIFIADGHHRYETALEYKRMRPKEDINQDGSEGYNYTLMYFSNIEEEGLVIYPIHRVIRGIKNFHPRSFLSELSREFDVEPFDSREHLEIALREQGRSSFGIALAGESSFYLARLRNRSRLSLLIPPEVPQAFKELDVVLLHEYILPQVLKVELRSTQSDAQVDYVRDENEALSSVERGEAQITFLLNPTGVDQLQAVARGGHTMPQKSTYFYPKLPAGLVMYNLERW